MLSRMLAVAVAAVAAAVPAQAGWIGTVDFQGTGAGDGLTGFTMQRNGTAVGNSGSIWVGEYAYKFTGTDGSSPSANPIGLSVGSTIHSYCLDIDTTLQDPALAKEKFLTNAAASQMAWIASVVANLNDAENGKKLGSGETVHDYDNQTWTAANKDYKAAGIQLALWKLLYDGPVTGLGTGTGFTVTGGNTSAIAFANTILADSFTKTGYQGTWFEQKSLNGQQDGQDFIGIGWTGNNPPPELAVPAPGGAVLGLAGAACLGLFRRRFRKA